MKAKKLFLLVAFTLILVVLVVGITGLALAAPKPLDTHQPLSVEGTVEWVDWIFGEVYYVDDEGNTCWSGNVITWTLEGDLEGTYVQTITYVTPPGDSGAYGIVGSCTFEGTVLGAKTSWTADVEGSGLMDLSDMLNHPFKGEDSWTSALTSSASPLSHMRGDIFIEGVFDEPYYSIYTYTGTIVWQTGKKN